MKSRTNTRLVSLCLLLVLTATGFALVLDPALIGELGSAGEYSWGGAAGTRFWIDPQEQLIGIFMVQSLPHQTELGSKFRLLTYQAIVD